MATKAKKSAETQIKAIKGFDADLKCRGFQYEVGKTYEISGAVECCSTGFHACDGAPFDIWGYYGPVGEDGRLNRFADVTMAGAIDRDGGNDSKLAAAKITIDAEIRLPDFIKRAVSWVIDATQGKGDNPSGDYAQIGSSGGNARIGSSGGNAQIGSSGYNARIGSSGGNARIGSSGDNARIGSSGYNAQIGSSGYNARIGSSGYNARIGSSGDNARIGSSGGNARIGSSGYNARIGSSGYNAQIGSSGYNARIVVEGKNSVVASAGANTTVSGPEGMHVALAEFDNTGRCAGFAVGCIGKDGLLPNTPYRAKGGKLVAVTTSA